MSRSPLLAIRPGALVLLAALSGGIPGAIARADSPEASSAADGASARSAAGDEAVNELCPVLTDEPVDRGIHMLLDGRRVAFCCPKCLRLFRADPAAYAANLPGQVPTEDAAHGEHGDEHDHASHAAPVEGGAPWGLVWLGRFHPMLVHFPVALLIMALFAELLGGTEDRGRHASAARFCLWAGAIGAIVAAPLGWAHAVSAGEAYTGFPARILLAHRWLGTATAAVAGVAVYACERYHRGGEESHRRWYRGALLLGALLVGVTAHLGGSLIYGWDYLAW